MNEENSNDAENENTEEHHNEEKEANDHRDELSSEIVSQDDLLSLIPAEERKDFVTRAVSFFTSTFSIGPQPNPLISKFNDQHITKMLDQIQSDSIRSYESRKSERRYNVFYFSAVLGALLLVLIHFQSRDPELLNTILQILLGFVGGFGAGYGYKSLRRDS